MIDFLSSKLVNTFNKIRGTSKITEANLNEICNEIKIAFLESDVNYKITTDFINNVKTELLNKTNDSSLSIKNKILATFEKEMLHVLGEKKYSLNIDKKPTFIMIMGLQGSGKTTMIVKLANKIKSAFHKSVLVVCTDVNRPAAYEQLSKMCKSINVPTYFKNSSTPSYIAQSAISEILREQKYDVVLFDTAGRNTVNNEVLDELVKLKNIIKPKEIILNVDALSGQSIIHTIDNFKSKVNITCATLSKFDSEAKSGSAFSITYLAKIPIIFLGTGEKISDLEIFYPDRVVKRIMGYGDLLSLSEKVSENINEKSAKSMLKRFTSGNIDLEDMIKSLEKFKKMGSFSTIMKLVPGAPNLSKEKIQSAEHKLKLIKTVANSTTIKERRNVSLLYVPSRKNRIIKGSGVTQTDYNKILKQIRKFKEQSKNMQQMIQQKGLNKFGL